MANGPEIAQAYVTIIPSMKGAQKTISAELDAEKLGEEAGAEMGGGLLAGIKDIALGTVLGNMIADGIRLALDGIGDMFSDAFSGAADFEQLAGGMEKLYGDASDRMLELAQNAYRTSGVSANEYMEQATRFSASLINDLGGDTAAAAELTDIAMRAMSDNVNTFGVDIGNVQNAFQGLARGNYSMLDNLSLGYSGSRSEMERLIADANEYARSQGMAGDLVIDSFADQIRAIELIQEKQGIAGTTAKESASTISGSMAMLGASWQNLLTSLAGDQAGIDAAIAGVVESLAAAASNVVPAVLRIGAGALSAIPELMGSAVSAVAEAIVPMLDEMTGGAASEILARIQEIIAPLQENVLPVLQDVFGRIGEAAQRMAPILASIADGAMRLLAQAAEAVGWAFDALSPAISFVADLFGGALVFALDAVAGLFQLLTEAIEFLRDLIQPVADFIVEEFELVASRLEPIIDGIGGLFGGIGDFLADPLGAIGDFVTGGSNDMERLEQNANRSTSTMEREVTRHAQDMTRATTSSADRMAQNVTSSTTSMASSASSTMASFSDSVSGSMEAAALNTATQTAAMQASIDGLEGRDVDVNTVTNDYRAITEDVQSRVSGIMNRTVEIFTQTHNPSKGTLFGAANGVLSQLLSIQWGATGGIIDGVTLLGAGEAGAEALVPFSNRTAMRPLVQALAAETGAEYYDRRTYELLTEYAPAILRAIPNLNRRDFDRMSRGA